MASKEEEAAGLMKAEQDDLTSAHTWKPIKRSFLRSSPLENSGVFMLSELPIPVLHMEFDWAVKKKNVRMFIWVLISLFFVILELELAFDHSQSRYIVQDRCEALKAVNSFITTLLLYYLYDYYDYQIAGAKKEWYKALYDGENPGPMPTFSLYGGSFAAEFCLLFIHAVPYGDFRYWEDATGVEKPFISDKINALCLLRLYTVIRVIRDYTLIYARRRLVYDGGYRQRGGPEINYKLAMKATMSNHETTFVAALYLASLLTWGYILHACERDWQPEKYTYKNCIWLTAFMFAAMDFNDMAAMSEMGTLVSMFIIVWGLIVLSMLVNVIFNSVVLTSYEGWAIDWLVQYELCEDERQASADLIAHWWARKLAVRNGKGGDEEASAGYLILLCQQFKKLREVTYLINRNNPDANTDPMTELQFGMKADLKAMATTLLGEEEAESLAEDEPSSKAGGMSLATPVAEQAELLAARVAQMEEVQGAILKKIETMYTKQKGKAPQQ